MMKILDWSEGAFGIKTYIIEDLNGKKIVEVFYEKDLKKSNRI